MRYSNAMQHDITLPEIIDIPFRQALEERYFAYAMSTITARSLPDVRDGLKPVHRRLLYAMLRLKLAPETGFKKCARVVGDVIGKYHPHGDSAVYEALVRLAQSFAVRYPLVEGQGNFGSIDGDNAAAMRYTEARLTPFAMALLADLDKDTVDFRDTYDGEENEPVVLPAAVPNLLANGSEGIAVGMATSIPPHNVEELLDGILHLLHHPEAEMAELSQFIHAPDFPTGGIVMETQATICQAYTTGRGSFRVRARYEVEDLGRGVYQIIVTEIPYQVQKSRLIEKIAELFKNKKLPLLGNIRDESAEEVRIVFEPKSRTIDPALLMESLYKTTDLEVRFAMNLNVLTSAGVPKVLSLKGCLSEYITHRYAILQRKATHRMAGIDKRLEILAGLLVAYLNLDEVIAIIRHEDEPKQVMMARFGINDVQAEAILNMRLRSLRKLEEIEIKGEQAALEAEKAELLEVLNNPAKARQVLDAQFKDAKQQFGKHTALGARRTTVQHEVVATPDITPEAFIEKEPITVIITEKQWIKAIKGHHKEVPEGRLKEGDAVAMVLEARTTDSLIFVSDTGRCYSVLGDNVPRGSSAGEPLRLLIDLPADERIITAFIYMPATKMLFAATNGKGSIVDTDNMTSSTKAGKNVFSVAEGATVHSCQKVTGDMVAVIGDNRKLLIFPVNQIPEIARGQGVMLQRYKGAKLSDICTFQQSEGLSWTLGSRTRHETDLTTWISNRGGVGKFPPVGFPRNNKFSG
jgi:topoisomerase-4 subunit A